MDEKANRGKVDRQNPMTAKQYKEAYQSRGWSNKELAARWNKHPNSLSRIVNDKERDLHWDDAVLGLPLKN